MVRARASSHRAVGTVRVPLFHRMANGWYSRATSINTAMIMAVKFTSFAPMAQICVDSRTMTIVITSHAGDRKDDWVIERLGDLVISSVFCSDQPTGTS